MKQKLFHKDWIISAYKYENVLRIKENIHLQLVKTTI